MCEALFGHPGMIGSNGLRYSNLSVFAPLLVASASVLTQPACAQSWSTVATLQANARATTNGNRAPSGEERKDLVTSLRPSLFLSAEGTGLKVTTSMTLDLVADARGGSGFQAVPALRGDAKATLASGWLFVEAAMDIHQVEVDPFAARVESTSQTNGRLSKAYRISPYLSHQFSPTSGVLVRHDEDGTASGSSGVTGQETSKTVVRFERKAVAVPASVEWQRQEVRFSGSGHGQWTLESMKARFDFSLPGDLVAGPNIGQERSTFALGKHIDGLYGAHLRWNPTERSQLTAELEHRFFGTSWDLNARHRTPLMSLALRWSRTPLTSATSLGVASAGTDLTTFLDAILTTRYPDAAARGALVNNLISSRGLSTQLQGAVDFRAEYAQLQDTVNFTWVLLSGRSSLSVTAYRQSLRLLTRPSDPVNALLAAGADNEQTGVTLGLNRKLTPRMSADLTLTRSRVTGLSARQGDDSEERTHRLSATLDLSMRTTASAGVQYNRFSSSVVGINDHVATSAFVGLNHRF